MAYKIYTSYFGNLKKLHESGITPISIALWTPKWFNGPCMIELAPTRFMLSDACSNELYVKMYEEKLANLYTGSVLKKIEDLGRGHDVALLCYEKPGDFCHRHLFAEWFTKMSGISVEEFTYEKVKVPQYEEGNLF